MCIKMTGSSVLAEHMYYISTVYYHKGFVYMLYSLAELAICLWTGPQSACAVQYTKLMRRRNEHEHVRF